MANVPNSSIAQLGQYQIVKVGKGGQVGKGGAVGKSPIGQLGHLRASQQHNKQPVARRGHL